MHKLPESIPSTNMKIIELFNKIESGSLISNPDFQRKLVWKKQHKFHFIETILKNYPFPEVYIASLEMDIDNISATEIVVDGQQRLTTIIDYIKGEGDFTNQLKIPKFNDLVNDDKRAFLNYLITVKDLKDMDMDNIKDIFKRINNTEYSLNTVEKINAQYGDGEFVIFSKLLLESDYNPNDEVTDIVINQEDKQKINDFFNQNSIFNENDIKRMFALQFIMSIVSTMIHGDYFSRHSKTNEFIELYNEEFSEYENIVNTIVEIVEFINSLEFNSKSYWFNKANVFTLIIELSKVNIVELNIEILKEKLNSLELNSKKYFADIDLESIDSEDKKYFEFAKEGVNEKRAREHRGFVINKLLEESK